MEYCTREGYIVKAKSKDRTLRFLYGCRLGRLLVKALIRPSFSEAGGRFLSTRHSRIFIRPFIRRNSIDMNEYEYTKYKSYNDFFTRRILPESRPFDMHPDHLVSPCDGKLTVCPICGEGTFDIKGTKYTLESLLRSQELADKYLGGTALIFRLTVDDFHRYYYIDDGFECEGTFIEGVFHTVNPIAGRHFPVYKENCRDYSVLDSFHFGAVLMMEVGALMVGRIVNHRDSFMVFRGKEKGYFEFGGSTIVLLFEKNRIELDKDIIFNTQAGIETKVKAGEKIGERAGEKGQFILDEITELLELE